MPEPSDPAPLVPRTWLYGLAALVVLGAAMIVVGGTPRSIGYGVLGAVALLGFSLAFYAVGRSEDRERDRQSGR